MSDSTRATGQLRTDAAQVRLLGAAVAAFAEKGFHGTTTRDIAAAAGMSPAALYLHFRSKEELLYVISRAGHEDTLALVLRGRATTSDPVQQLRTVINDFASHHARNHTSTRVVNYELSALEPEHLAEVQELRRRIDQEMQDLVRQGVESGVFRTLQPRVSATALLSLAIDLARWYRDGGAWTPDEIGELYADLALRIVGATG